MSRRAPCRNEADGNEADGVVAAIRAANRAANRVGSRADAVCGFSGNDAPSAAVLNVSEIFASLQGEGPFMGQPAVFVRLAGCVPPFCSWCDTPHALSSGTPMAPRDVAREVAAHAPGLVVITGGEPFLQWRTGLSELAGLLEDAGRRVQYETSGKAGIPEACGGYVVCSPKLLHTAPQWDENLKRADVFKFVVDDDIAPVLDFLEAGRAHRDIAPGEVWLMPKGATREEQMARMERVWEWCVRYGFNFAPRLHVLTYGARRGV